jgi:hypothetical protein
MYAAAIPAMQQRFEDEPLQQKGQFCIVNFCLNLYMVSTFPSWRYR